MDRYSERVRGAMDRACKITAFRIQFDLDEDIIRKMIALLEPWKKWPERTPEQEEMLEEELASRATCPKDGAAAVWCEKED